jgi:hypothetical protein
MMRVGPIMPYEPANDAYGRRGIGRELGKRVKYSQQLVGQLLYVGWRRRVEIVASVLQGFIEGRLIRVICGSHRLLVSEADVARDVRVPICPHRGFHIISGLLKLVNTAAARASGAAETEKHEAQRKQNGRQLDNTVFHSDGLSNASSTLCRCAGSLQGEITGLIVRVEGGLRRAQSVFLIT